MTWYRFQESSVNEMYKRISQTIEEAGIKLENKDVLIVGIGEGLELQRIPIIKRAFEEDKARFYAIDVEDTKFPGKEKVDFRRVDVRDISKSTFGKTFDVILLNNVIVYFSNYDGIITEEGYKDTQRALRNLYNILNRGGYLILTTEYEGKIIREGMGWSRIKRFIDLEKLEKIIKGVGFQIELKRDTFIRGKEKEVSVYTYFPACPGMIKAAAYEDVVVDTPNDRWVEYERNEIKIYVLRKV